jgi:hypothetical protein
MRHSAIRLAKRIATGGPAPSPQLKVDPAAVVIRRFPVRISLRQTARSNRSIGRLPRVNVFARGAMGVAPAPHRGSDRIASPSAGKN